MLSRMFINSLFNGIVLFEASFTERLISGSYIMNDKE